LEKTGHLYFAPTCQERSSKSLCATTLASAWLIASGTGPALGPLPITAWLGVVGLMLAGSGFWVLAYGVLRSGRF
jgi:hypothetical protein